MSSVLVGFVVVFVVIGVGYLLGRTQALGPDAQRTLSLLNFFVATPALLFDTLTHAELTDVFSLGLVATSTSALLLAAMFFLLARRYFHLAVPEAVIGALSTSYVNSANLGIPIAIYVLGNPSIVAPLLLFQIIIFSPIALTILDATALERDHGPAPVDPSRRVRHRLGVITQPLRNPIVLGGLIGLAVALSPWHPPEVINEPVHLLGQASVPCALLAFGISLYGVRVFERGVSPRRLVSIITVAKLVVHPLLAWFIGAIILGMSGEALRAVVIMSALPTAQNVLVYATRYQRGTIIARDSGAISTVASIPALMVVAMLFP